MRSTKTKIEPTFDTDRNRWKVDVPASISTNGKRFRQWFATRDKARSFVADITGADAAAIPLADAADANKARDILKRWNLDLVQGARLVEEALEALDGAGSILQAAKAYRAAHDQRTASVPLSEAVKVYLDSRQDLRDATLRSYRYTMEGVLAPVGSTVMADIKTENLEACFTGKGSTARRMHRRNLRVFWKWAATPPRQWADMAVVDALEAPRGSSEADIAILSPADVKALLRAAEAESGPAACSYAIALFAGVRMAELSRLRWRDITEDHIEIGKSIAKKQSRRLVPICPALRSWLDTYRGEATESDTIVGANWADVSKSVRRRAGWNVAARLLTDPPKPTRGSWPANACRHTSASVQVAIGTSLEALVFAFGHSGGHDILRSHYVSRLTKKSALEILATGPKGKSIRNISAA